MSVLAVTILQFHFFDTARSFLDRQYDEEGNPLAPKRYKDLVKECYVVSKNCNIPYSDVLKMGCKERGYLLSFIVEEFEKMEQHSKEQQEKIKNLKSR